MIAAGLFAEAGRDAALSWLRGRTLCAPHLVDCEIANTALRKHGRREFSARMAVELLRTYAAMPIERHTVDAGEVLDLAIRTRLTAYDASYLWLARRLGAPLATFDARLGAAALRELRDG